MTTVTQTIEFGTDETTWVSADLIKGLDRTYVMFSTQAHDDIAQDVGPDPDTLFVRMQVIAKALLQGNDIRTIGCDEVVGDPLISRETIKRLAVVKPTFHGRW